MTDQSSKTKGDNNPHPPQQQQEAAAAAIEQKEATSLLATFANEALAYVTCTKRRTLLNPMVCFAIALIIGISAASLIGLYRRDVERQLLRPLNVTIMAFPPVILFFLLSSVYIDPAVSDDEMAKFLEKNPSVKKSLRFCTKCNKYKPYRASHCSFCNKCVVRRDHHCPWINNCVSFFNHKQFILFLIVTSIGLSVNVIVLYSNFRAFSAGSQNKQPTLTSMEMISFMAGIFALSLLLVLPLILSQQIYAVVKNCAACEEYDLDRVNVYLRKKNRPYMSNIYNIDLKTNIMQIWNASSHNGIVFPTIKGFSNNQFSKCARSIDDENCDAVLARSPHCTVTTQKYDGSLIIKNQLMTTLFNPKFYSNVLTCEQGEVVYLKQPTLSSRWTQCYKLVSFDTGNIVAEGFLPSSVLKNPVDN